MNYNEEEKNNNYWGVNCVINITNPSTYEIKRWW